MNLQDTQSLVYAITQAVSIKAKVVSSDEKEKGIRAALNYGHTFGHAIENLTEYKRYLHGEAVSIGMCMANALSYELGFLQADEAKAIKNLLEKYNLPTFFEISDVLDFYEKFYLDKKSADSKIMFILPKGLGDVALCEDVPKQKVLKILSEFEK